MSHPEVGWRPRSGIGVLLSRQSDIVVVLGSRATVTPDDGVVQWSAGRPPGRPRRVATVARVLGQSANG
jgi:hypothetical protein